MERLHLEAESKKFSNESQKVEHQAMREVTKVKQKLAELITELRNQADNSIKTIDQEKAIAIQQISLQ